MSFLSYIRKPVAAFGGGASYFGETGGMSGQIAAPKTASSSVLNRAWSQIARTVKEIGPRRRDNEINLKADLPGTDEERLLAAFQECIDHRGGEVAARARAAAIGQAYLGLNVDGRRRFSVLLSDRFAVDRAAVDAAIQDVQSANDGDDRSKAETQLRDALQAPRVRVLRQFNALPEGVKFLVDMRAELLGWQRETPVLKPLQQDLQRLLASWFDVGFLQLQQIDWSAPAALLEKLIEYEAVHRIRSWDDLKNRLDSDRRCYAFFHPRMPDEPLIFVEVALVQGIAGDVGELLDMDKPAGDPARADTAIFYSISNAQKGLSGISFGDFLLKRVVAALSQELPNLKNFATLSPIPGLARWMSANPDEVGATPLTTDERKALRAAIADTDAGLSGEGKTATLDAGDPPEPLDDDLSDQDLITAALATKYWSEDTGLAAALAPPMLRLASDYLLNCKGRGGRALDPVAHFHLSNGARMERLNWLGDRSGNGIRQSAGMMINYLYKLSEIDQNHESYSAPDRVIPVSNGIKALAKR
jgi:malonyl-CoA decarboxylase